MTLVKVAGNSRYIDHSDICCRAIYFPDVHMVKRGGKIK